MYKGCPSCSPLINKCHQCERNLRGSPSEVARGKLTPRVLAKTFLSRITEGMHLSLPLSHTALSILYLRLTHGFLRFAPTTAHGKEKYDFLQDIVNLRIPWASVPFCLYF